MGHTHNKVTAVGSNTEGLSAVGAGHRDAPPEDDKRQGQRAHPPGLPSPYLPQLRGSGSPSVPPTVSLPAVPSVGSWSELRFPKAARQEGIAKGLTIWSKEKLPPPSPPALLASESTLLRHLPDVDVVYSLACTNSRSPHMDPAGYVLLSASSEG